MMTVQLECERDHLILYDGAQNIGAPLASMCTKPEQVYNSSNHQFVIALITDASISMAGFNLSWAAIGMNKLQIVYCQVYGH